MLFGGAAFHLLFSLCRLEPVHDGRLLAPFGGFDFCGLVLLRTVVDDPVNHAVVILLSLIHIYPPDALKEGIQQGYEERNDFPEVLPQGVWDKVNVQRFSMKNCGSCEKKCKYYKVRASLKYTDGVVLCNQDFLTQHLMKLRRGQDGLINAAADLLVVDEAHNLDDKVRSATTERFGQGMLFGMIKSAFYELRPSDQSSVSGEKREAESAIIAFYNCLKAQVQKQIDDADQDMRYADRFFFDQSGSAIELLTEMNAAIHNLSSSIQIYSSMDFRNNRSFAASDDLDAVSESLSELLDQIDDMLIWIEQHGSNTELVYCPKNTKEIVSRLYFNGDERTILTSATLTNATSGSLEEQYSYFISNTGFPAGDRGCLSEPKPSPYPYDEPVSYTHLLMRPTLDSPEHRSPQKTAVHERSSVITSTSMI